MGHIELPLLMVELDTQFLDTQVLRSVVGLPVSPLKRKKLSELVLGGYGYVCNRKVIQQPMYGISDTNSGGCESKISLVSSALLGSYNYILAYFRGLPAAMSTAATPPRH